MYLALRSRWRARAGDERGFTLIEMLVALSIGTIVLTAMLAILISSVDLSSANNDSIEANQQGRLAMTKLVQALDSSCVAATTPPVLAGSDANHVVFYSLLGDAPSINPSEITVTYGASTTDPLATANSLTMYTQPWVSGTSSSSWTFGTGTNFTLLDHMSPATVNGTGNQPVFQYYGYNSGTGTMSTTPYTTPLSAANALTTTEIAINFEALPSDNWNAATGDHQDTGSVFSDSIVLRLTPASANASSSNTPCT
jgi:prepilin-type N-terminal cleavage/methylation domain-containing protein